MARFAVDTTSYLSEVRERRIPAANRVRPLFLRITRSLPLARVLVLDKWAGNADGRQVIFSKPAKARKYNATFIDQGYCFNAGEWSFPDSPLRGIYARNCVYEWVTGWQSFEPALSRAEQMDYNELCTVASGLPEDWWLRYGHSDALSCLFDSLYQRRSNIRDLITAFRNSSRNPFPNWKD